MKWQGKSIRIFPRRLLLTTILAFMVCTWNGVVHAEEHQSPAPPPIVISFLATQGGAGLAERMNAASELLLNKPFSWFPLGEGDDGEYDQRPLFRFDEFDCSTWVETVLALGLSHEASDFVTLMNQIRYRRGVISFQTRNHLPDVDWIENAVELGILRETTREIAGEFELKSSTIRNSRKLWYSRLESERIYLPQASPAEQSRKLSLLRNSQGSDPSIVSTVNYIPMESILVPREKAAQYPNARLRPLEIGHPIGDYPRNPKDYLVNQALLDRIETPALIQVIKPGWDRRKDYGLFFNIGHRGILNRRNGKLYFQQMSLRLKHSVEIPFEEDVFYRLIDPPVKGFNFYRILDPKESSTPTSAAPITSGSPDSVRQ